MFQSNNKANFRTVACETRLPVKARVSPAPRVFLALILVVVSAAGIPVHAASTSKGKIEFNRDVRPILSDTCFSCHGPDKKALKARLRLDLREVAIEKG